MAPKSLFYSLFSTISVALASSIPQTDYDVIVVGGGPAGLSVLSSLGRMRRRTVMFDSGEYRNSVTREMHDVLGFDGTPPAQFRGLARQQISKYNSTSVIDIKIDTITPIEDAAANSSYFRAVDANGTEYTSRKVVLGTGLVDVIPDVPGLREAWGKGIWWCPWCDGYEHRDEPLGILGSLTDVVGSVMETHTLYSDIIAFTNGTYTPANEIALAAKYPNWKEQLEAWNIGIDNRSIASIERLQDGDDHRDDTGRQYDIFRVHFTDGSSVVRNTFITNYPTAQRSTLPEELSLVMVDNKIDTTDYTGMRTSLSGVYAVGDCNSDGSTNVPHAMFSGKRAGVYVHVEMSREESNAAISKRDFDRRALEKQTERMVGNEMEDLWKRVLDNHHHRRS
ncbi:NAD(P)/FAD-dependent oxidoreductase [Aspergillus vadensis CBS 113365]|uniref:Sulphydryl oxidase Sox n=1 Tax=Aspergillus vadensis (strain CBS 113365 / IMI 142717 / IBT 24658) TaxID=1448311 RepID=A0A319BAA3_ASPVC|nr:sulphydryl oxidase Sox [Aspergillus vadensis CBS 113365]PYH69319.1 sulphydryl oxidase Sox [Aspergillus vadensis CBS 113365]